MTIDEKIFNAQRKKAIGVKLIKVLTIYYFY